MIAGRGKPIVSPYRRDYVNLLIIWIVGEVWSLALLSTLIFFQLFLYLGLALRILANIDPYNYINCSLKLGLMTLPKLID